MGEIVDRAPSLAAQWLLPRLRGLIEKHPELEVRLAAGTDYPHFRNDEFDIDICYGPPRQEGMAVLPLGEEIIRPMCAPSLAGAIREPADQESRLVLSRWCKEFSDRAPRDDQSLRNWPDYLNPGVRTTTVSKDHRSHLQALVEDGFCCVLTTN